MAAPPARPAPTVLPHIAGQPVAGATLTTSRGTWANKPTGYAYQWLTCSSDGTGCSPLAGATTRTITVPAEAAGDRLRVKVRAHNSRGTRSVTSPASAVVTSTAPAASAIFSDTFTAPDGLITNEYAHWNPTHSDAKISPRWEMTSGSLFEKDGTGWTGIPDGCASASPQSTPCTASDVFRMNSVSQAFGNVTVSLDLLNNGLTTSSRTPAVNWDGVHVWLRYQSEYNLYYASFNRRDGHIVIKKKCVGGPDPDNGGTYYELGQGELAGYPIPFGTWQHLKVSVQNTSGGDVVITMWRDGTQLLTATDSGMGCAPITAPGGVGIRGDNDNFQFDNFTVTPN